MNNRIKVLLSSAVFLLFAFSGFSDFGTIFPSYNSVSNESIVLAIGLDRDSDDTSKMKITFSENLVTPSEDGSNQQSNSQNSLSSGSGKTFTDALVNTQLQANKTLFLGHTQVMIVGESAAKDNIRKYIEYIIVDPQVRMNINLFVAKETTGQDLMKMTPPGGQNVSDKLKSMVDDVSNKSIVNSVKLASVVSSLESEFRYTAIPAIAVCDYNISDEKNIELCGYGIFKEYKLVGYLNRKESATLNLLKNTVDVFPLSVNNQTFSDISVSLYNTKTQIKYHSDSQNVTIDCTLTAKLAEPYLEANLQDNVTFNSSNIKLLEATINQTIKNNISDLIKKSKEQNHDFINIGDLIYRTHPSKWEKLSENWDEIFPEMDFKINVNTRVVN